MSFAFEATAWLASQLPQMESALVDLVQVNSYTDNGEGGRRVGERLAPLFDFGGIEVRRVASARYADHWVFSTAGAAGQKPIALIGHLDTVFPPGTFEGYRREGARAHGPGVFDMKGGLVLAAWALRALERAGGLARLPPLRLVVVSDEEVGSPEGQGVIREAIAGSCCALGLEPGRESDAIVTRRKGTAGMTAVAHGKAAHAGNAHDKGHNAIWALAKFVDAAQQLTDYPRGITLNVGRISGGQSKNTVPDHAEAQLDLRFNTQADSEQLRARLTEAAARAAEAVKGTRLELSLTAARLPMERSDASLALMNEYGVCAKKAGLNFSEAPLVGGGSDASTSSAMGIPSIDSLGPRGGGFHTKEEYIELDSLVLKAQALALFLSGRVP